MVGVLKCWTQFWKGAIQGSFHKSLVAIGPVVSEEKIFILCLYSSNLGTFWLKIEQFWPFEEISIFSNGGHLGYRTVLTDTNLKRGPPKDHFSKFWFRLAQ